MREMIKALLSPILGPLIDKIPDVNERRRLEAQLESNLVDALSAIVQGQLKINEKEAGHSSIFVAGWRPAIGWICGAALGWNFIVQPLILWVAWMVPEGADLATAPALDTGELMTVLLGMLGLGGLRTYEKSVGVARKSLNAKSD